MRLAGGLLDGHELGEARYQEHSGFLELRVADSHKRLKNVLDIFILSACTNAVAQRSHERVLLSTSTLSCDFSNGLESHSGDREAPDSLESGSIVCQNLSKPRRRDKFRGALEALPSPAYRVSVIA